jgi:hypothetical protein
VAIGGNKPRITFGMARRIRLHSRERYRNASGKAHDYENPAQGQSGKSEKTTSFHLLDPLFSYHRHLAPNGR